MTFMVNGKAVNADCAPLTRLIDYIRDTLKMTGTKEGCGEGECGACAVLLDGRVVNSCLIPIAAVEGKSIVTIEGFSETERGRAIAKAFAEQGAVQCGFCTPGMVLSAQSILEETGGDPDEEEVRAGLSGNLCRCTGYDHIVAAVLTSAPEWRKAGKNGGKA